MIPASEMRTGDSSLGRPPFLSSARRQDFFFCACLAPGLFVAPVFARALVLASGFFVPAPPFAFVMIDPALLSTEMKERVRRGSTYGAADPAAIAFWLSPLSCHWTRGSTSAA